MNEESSVPRAAPAAASTRPEASPVSAGVLAAALTPLKADLSVDHALFAENCRWLLASGCNGLAILGTTSEANSFSVEERIEIMERLVAAGVEARVLMPGVGCCAIPDTVRLAKRALDLGASGVLMLPPFYYKNPTDDGLFAAYSEAIERIGDGRLRVYLYHIPPMSQIPLSHALIARLIQAYPGAVVGIKDSGGMIDNMTAMVKAFPGFVVLSGADQLLLPLLKAGGAGCITAVCNVCAPLARELYDAFKAGDAARAEAAHQRIATIREIVSGYPLVPSLRTVMAHYTGNEAWRRPRPPLVPLGEAQRAELLRRLAALNFALPARQ